MFLPASNNFADDDIEMTDVERASSAFSYFSFNSGMVFDDDDDEMEDRSTGSSPLPFPLLATVVPNEVKFVYDDFYFVENSTNNGVYLNVYFKSTGLELFHVSIHCEGIRKCLEEGYVLTRELFHIVYNEFYYSIKLNKDYLVGKFNKKIAFPVSILNEYLRRNIKNNDFTKCIDILCSCSKFSNYWV